MIKLKSRYFIMVFVTYISTSHKCFIIFGLGKKKIFIKRDTPSGLAAIIKSFFYTIYLVPKSDENDRNLDSWRTSFQNKTVSYSIRRLRRVTGGRAPSLLSQTTVAWKLGRNKWKGMWRLWVGCKLSVKLIMKHSQLNKTEAFSCFCYWGNSPLTIDSS